MLDDKSADPNQDDLTEKKAYHQSLEEVFHKDRLDAQRMVPEMYGDDGLLLLGAGKMGQNISMLTFATRLTYGFFLNNHAMESTMWGRVFRLDLMCWINVTTGIDHRIAEEDGVDDEGETKYSNTSHSALEGLHKFLEHFMSIKGRKAAEVRKAFKSKFYPPVQRYLCP